MELEFFDAGKVFNPITNLLKEPILQYKSLEVTVPARLNAMCFDLKTLAKPKRKFIYNAGELAFSVDVSTYAKLSIAPDGLNNLKIVNNTKRKSLVRHAALIMKETLKTKDSFLIEANNIYDYPHAGLGSSSSIITAVCIAINEAYGNPIDKRDLTLLIAQNHGEEIEGDENRLIHVQCNGGSPCAALYNGGMQIIAGNSNMILRENIPEEYSFVFGIPKIYKNYDAKYLMNLEKKQFSKMLKSSKDFSREISWKVLHEIIPSMINKEIYTIGDVLEYYRMKTGSLKIDSLTWNGLYGIVKDLLKLRDEFTPIVSISSCGPIVYVLTKKPEMIKKALENKGMKVFFARPNNCGYKLSINSS